ncbi:MAG: helix-turn-helix domain-containing protein [Pseudomonadota bacterium]
MDLESRVRAIVRDELAKFHEDKSAQDEFLNTKQVAELTGLSVPFFEMGRSRSAEDQPPYHRVGRRILYRKQDVLDWLEGRKRGVL